MADVVVVGGGGSGLSAAIAAAARGLRVVLLEKNARLGGSTGLSVGSFSAAGTSLQARRGIDDSVDKFAADVKVMNGDLEEHDNTALRELLLHGATQSFEWLRSLGVQFFGPNAQPPFTVERMYQIVPNSRAYVAALEREARRRGVDIRTGTRVTKLLRDEAGRVVGVRADVDHRARRAVILGTGDYSASPELKARYASARIGRLPPVNVTNTGDGFFMAMEIGAGVRNMWRVLEDFRFPAPRGIDIPRALPMRGPSALLLRIAIERLPRAVLRLVSQRVLTSWVAPSKELFAEGAILVNAEGRRFADELRSPAEALGDQPEHRCYILMDSEVGDLFRAAPHPISTFPGIAYAYLGDYQALRPDVTHVAPTIDGLARAIGLSADALRQSVDRYNTFVAAGRDEEFGRVSLGPGLRRPPYVALGPLFGRVVLTDGGLTINGRCQVLDEAGEPIAGLYAVGATGQGGLVLKGHGLHLAWAMTSGRIAGQAVADEPVDERREVEMR